MNEADEQNTIIYFDNYRGFKDTYLPIKDINFFVGENSTGKTSVLSLIYLLSSPNFWFSYDFNSEPINLGSFSDIATSNSDEPSFKIAIFNYGTEEGSKSRQFNCMYFNFGNVKEVPFLLEFGFASNGYNIISKIAKNGKSILYKILDEPDDVSPENQFKKWISDMKQNVSSKGYSKISGVNIFNFSIYSILQSIEDDLIEKKKRIKSDSPDPKPMPQRTTITKGFFKFQNWIAPIRAKPKRTYDAYEVAYSPEGNHTPYILKSLLSAKKSAKKENKLNLMNSFGKDSGMFDEIKVKQFSRDSTSPFEIDIEFNSRVHKISNVGYGVSQVLPILMDSLMNRERTSYIIQQPEVHLHPKAQASLGELFYKLTTKENKQFLIETHSDYLIDRFRLSVHTNKGTESSKLEFQVIFFEKTTDGNILHLIEILDNGQYSEVQPESFTEFFIKEELSLLEIDSCV